MSLRTKLTIADSGAIFSKKWLKDYILIVLGSFIMALGYVLFINPYNIVPGGVFGLGIVAHHLVPAIPIGLFGLAVNIPLTLLGIKILGPRFGVKTVVGMVLTATLMDILTHYIGENDPLGIQEELLLCCVFGGITIGVGLGLIFRSKATSGGSDIIAAIFAKYTKMPLGQLLIYIDSVIVLVGLIVFKDWKVPLYSWIVIFVTGKVIDVVLEGLSYYKTLYIISDHHELIREKILNELNRGGTYFSGEGLFSHNQKQVIFTVVNRRELSMLKEYVIKIDPNAFIVVNDANDIIGKGFRYYEPENAL